MTEHTYSANELLDLELRFKSNPVIIHMLKTIEELQEEIKNFSAELTELKVDLTDILETAHENLTNELDKRIDADFKS